MLQLVPAPGEPDSASSCLRSLNRLDYRPLSRQAKLFRHAVFGRLSKLEHGIVTVIAHDGRHRFGQGDATSGLHAELHITDPAAYRRIALHGSIGAGEAYMEQQWLADDLVALVRIFALNREALDGLEKGLALLYQPVAWALHRLRRNTKRGSRSNIAAHYDLGNDFYRLFLDETLMYSCGVFMDAASDLHAASMAKNERICRKLELGPNDHVLEIGTGWGGFALHAASRHGCRVTTTTISCEQYDLAKQRVHEAGLEDRVTLLFDDYRDLSGRFDKLVSIEMIEAVGYEYYPNFFRRCAELLEPSGMMLLQTITIADQQYDRAKHAVDFIQRYIFPGGCLPSVTALCRAATRASDLRLYHLEDIGPHYATTLRHWRDRFHNRLDEVRALGYPDSFVRMWEFYLCYCEGAFLERVIGNVQMLLVKPLCRRDSLTPAL